MSVSLLFTCPSPHYSVSANYDRYPASATGIIIRPPDDLV